MTDLRKENSAYDARLSAWIMFAEGLILHFETLDNAKTKDKFHRAFLVSQIANDRELAGTAAAWMAHCEFMSGQMKDAAAHVSKAFEWSDPDSSEARGRASMVLADTLNWAGKPDLAKHWYREARNHAIQDGDIAMQNVVLYNAAALGVWHLTIKDCADTTEADDRHRVSMETASATNLNAALGIDSLQSLLPIVQAEMLVVQSRWEEARRLFDENIEGLAREGQTRLLPKILAQRAWCKTNLGDDAGALADIDEALRQRDDCADLDDLAVLHFRIASAYRLLGKPELEEQHQAIASDCLKLFQQQQTEILCLLEPVIAAANAQ